MSTLKKSLQTLGAIAAISGVLAATPLSGSMAQANPCAPKAKKASDNKKAANPCAAAKNPCAAAKNPCAPKR